jgi:hypothetical protein
MLLRWIIGSISVVAVLLGGLWTVQGLGLLTIQPIMCVAECETVVGPAPIWAVVGLVVFAGGVLGLRYALRQQAGSSPQHHLEGR